MKIIFIDSSNCNFIWGFSLLHVIFYVVIMKKKLINSFYLDIKKSSSSHSFLPVNFANFSVAIFDTSSALDVNLFSADSKSFLSSDCAIEIWWEIVFAVFYPFSSKSLDPFIILSLISSNFEDKESTTFVLWIFVYFSILLICSVTLFIPPLKLLETFSLIESKELI